MRRMELNHEGRGEGPERSSVSGDESLQTAPKIEKNEEVQGFWHSIKDTMKANRKATLTFVGIIVFIIVIFCIAGFSPWWQSTTGGVNPLHPKSGADAPPSWAHWLGGTFEGYDNFITLMYGARQSIIIGFVVACISTPIAIVMGTIGAYKGGKLDEAFVQITNIALIFPLIPTILLLAAMGGGNQPWTSVALIIAVLAWPWAARCIRSQILTLREREFVNVARISGQRETHIAFVEVLPNMLPYIFLVFVINMFNGILTEAGVAIIGFGDQSSSYISLGKMLFWAYSRDQVQNQQFWEWMPPGILLIIILVLLFVLQSAMPAIFNPRLREK